MLHCQISTITVTAAALLFQQLLHTYSLFAASLKHRLTTSRAVTSALRSIMQQYEASLQYCCSIGAAVQRVKGRSGVWLLGLL